MRPGGAGPRRPSSGVASARRRRSLAPGFHPVLARAAGGLRAAALLRPGARTLQTLGMLPRLIRRTAPLREAGPSPQARWPAHAGGSAAQAGVPGWHLWRPALLWRVAGLRARARALPARHHATAGARGAAAALSGTLRPRAAQSHAWAMIYSGMWALFRAGCDADFIPDTLGCCAGQSPTLQGPQWGGRAQGADMKGTLDYFALNHYTSLCAPSEASASACPLPVRSCCASARQVAAHVLMAGTSTRASPQRNTGRLDAACSYLLCTACSRQGPTRHQVPDSLATCLL